MIFEASRAMALNQLNNFVENNLGEYSKLRNFDFGPEKRSVSYTHLTLPTRLPV